MIKMTNSKDEVIIKEIVGGACWRELVERKRCE